MIDISVSNLTKEFEVGSKILDGLSFQVDQGANSLRAHPGVQHGDVAAHAVADQVDLLAGCVVVQ